MRAVALEPTQAAAATSKCNTAVQMKPRPAYSYYMLIPKAVTSSVSTVTCYMDRGTPNNGVRVLQTALAYCYNVSTGVYGHTFGPADIDGIYGVATQSAVQNLQMGVALL